MKIIKKKNIDFEEHQNELWGKLFTIFFRKIFTLIKLYCYFQYFYLVCIQDYEKN